MAQKSNPNFKKLDHCQLWKKIVLEAEDYNRKCEEHLNKKNKTFEDELPYRAIKDTAICYMDREIFPLLCQALESALFQAKHWESLTHQKCRFNGIDHIAEFVWNKNPSHPDRHEQYLDIYDIPFVKKRLKAHPRPIFPKSYLWTREEASVVLQSYYRGHLIRKQNEVQEMRHFWKILKEERRLEDERRRILEEEQRAEEHRRVIERCTAILEDLVYYVERTTHLKHQNR